MPTNMRTHLLRQPPHARGTTDVVKHEHETTCNDVRPHPKHGGGAAYTGKTNNGKAICERNHNAPAARYTWCTCDATPVAASGPLPEENSLESQEPNETTQQCTRRKCNHRSIALQWRARMSDFQRLPTSSWWAPTPKKKTNTAHRHFLAARRRLQIAPPLWFSRSPGVGLG